MVCGSVRRPTMKQINNISHNKVWITDEVNLKSGKDAHLSPQLFAII